MCKPKVCIPKVCIPKVCILKVWAMCVYQNCVYTDSLVIGSFPKQILVVKKICGWKACMAKPARVWPFGVPLGAFWTPLTQKQLGFDTWLGCYCTSLKKKLAVKSFRKISYLLAHSVHLDCSNKTPNSNLEWITRWLCLSRTIFRLVRVIFK